MKMNDRLISNLQHHLSGKLPGETAQNLMSPQGGEGYRKLKPGYMDAAVMALFYPCDSDLNIALIERSRFYPGDKHAGQISLPGGKMDKYDATFQDCALRETYEEIGVLPEHVEVLGSLTSLFVFVSNFLVHPFVGFTEKRPKFELQRTEVKELIEMPIGFLMDSDNKKNGEIEVRGSTFHNVPYYDVYGKRVWGATAMILSEMEQVIRSI